MNAAQNLDAVEALLGETREGALGTVENGLPFVSATGFLYSKESSAKPPVLSGPLHLLLSDLSRHTRNLNQNPAASLLVVENSAAPIHEKKRATLIGAVKRVQDEGLFKELKKQYLELFPRSEIFFSLPDFRFYELEVREVHWIGGFGKAATFK